MPGTVAIALRAKVMDFSYRNRNRTKTLRGFDTFKIQVRPSENAQDNKT